MLNSIPLERATLAARSRSISQAGIGSRFILSTSLIVVLGFLMLLTWRELTSEFDASIRDYASSFTFHDRTDLR
jgi:hypothetical protein